MCWARVSTRPIDGSGCRRRSCSKATLLTAVRRVSRQLFLPPSNSHVPRGGNFFSPVGGDRHRPAPRRIWPGARCWPPTPRRSTHCSDSLGNAGPPTRTCQGCDKIARGTLVCRNFGGFVDRAVERGELSSRPFAAALSCRSGFERDDTRQLSRAAFIAIDYLASA